MKLGALQCRKNFGAGMHSLYEKLGKVWTLQEAFAGPNVRKGSKD